MLSCAMTIVLAVVLGQAGSPAADTTLLKAVPADAEVVLRVRSVEAARGDLSKMLEAMSPSAAEALKPMLDQGIGMFTTQYGEKAAQSPWLAIMKLPKPDAEGMPPYAVLVQTEDYAGVQKSLAGGKDVQPKKQPGGYDTIPGAEDKTIYTYK
ncbi:MAG: hypothetical protein IRY99_11995, partial [Isosphaeraceae bacterium]|nr:hypothetical protein [Isosphaeraceae bacterium]